MHKKVGDYGIIGNAQSVALVGSDGSIDWHCLPSLAGLILFELGHLPIEGEQLPWEDYLLTCTRMTPTAIDLVKIEPLEPKENLEERD